MKTLKEKDYSESKMCKCQGVAGFTCVCILFKMHKLFMLISYEYRGAKRICEEQALVFPLKSSTPQEASCSPQLLIVQDRKGKQRRAVLPERCYLQAPVNAVNTSITFQESARNSHNERFHVPSTVLTFNHTRVRQTWKKHECICINANVQ